MDVGDCGSAFRDNGRAFTGAGCHGDARHRTPVPIYRRVLGDDHRLRGRRLRARPGRARDPGLHLRADERHSRPLPSGDCGHRRRGGRPPRPPAQLLPLRCRPRVHERALGPPPGLALQGTAAQHRRRVQRSGDPDGEARDGPFRSGGLRPVLAWRDRGRFRGDLQRRPARLWRAGAGRAGAADPSRVPVSLRIQRHLRLARGARLRVRAHRPAVGRQPRGDDRRARPELGGHHRASGRLPHRACRALPAPRDAAHPRRGADRPRADRGPVRVRARRGGAGHPDPVQDPGRGAALVRDGRLSGSRAGVFRARLPVLHDPHRGPASRRGRDAR